MKTIEMIEKIQDLYTPDCGVYHMIGDLKARVESERAALQAAVDEIAILRDATRDDPDYQCARPSVVLGDALDIIAEKTGVKHGQ